MTIARSRNVRGLAAATILLSGSPPGDEGPVAFSRIGACFKVEQPSEKVFRTSGEWQAFNRASALRPANGAPPIDFARKMVVARFDGSGSACIGFTVEKVEVAGGVTTVRATRNTSPHPCIAVVAYPQLVLEVPRGDLPVRFRIRDLSQAPPSRPKPCF